MSDQAPSAEELRDSGSPQSQVIEEKAKQADLADEQDDDETSALKEWIELLVRAAGWALLIYIFLFQVSLVDGPSMRPNFLDYDRLVIDKLTYRFSKVRRNDVVVFQAIDFHQPREDRTNRDYIKRVIGLPGDVVKLQGGNVWVNGQQVQEAPGVPTSATFPDRGKDTFVVPPGQYMMMGDNRRESKDSRSDALGFISSSQIKGLVRMRFWPWGRFGIVERGAE